MSGKQVENDPHPVADTGRRRAGPRRRIDGAVPLASPQRVDHLIWRVRRLVVTLASNQANHARTFAHVVPLQLDAGEAVTWKERCQVLDAATVADTVLTNLRQVDLEAELFEEVLRHALAARLQRTLRTAPALREDQAVSRNGSTNLGPR